MITLIVFTPLIAALVLLFLQEDNKALIRMVALGAAGFSFLLSLGLLLAFDSTNPGMQFEASLLWVSMLNIKYHVGVDGISLLLVILTTFLSGIGIIYSLKQKNGLRNFLALMLALEAGTLGVFVALDTILFYVFWELMLVPTYFLIGLWGEGQRVYATTKFVLFTLVGSLLMLVAIIGISVVHFEATKELTFDIQTLVHTQIDPASQTWMFLFFFLAFAIKVPVFPFHSWLPHTYVACPIPTLIILTGAMSKTGAYGFLRFCLPLFPDAVEEMGLVIGALAAIGIVYGAWIAVAQKDLKALVAYSSISHLGFITLGIFALNNVGVEGSVLQMINHGIIAAALFIIVGILEEKTGSRNLKDFRGLGKSMPVLYGMFMLITLAALGLPGLNGFVGEFLILMGVWTSHLLSDLSTIYVLMAGLSIVLASIYMLYMFQGSMQETNPKTDQNLTDINRTEFGLLLPACVLIIFIGLFPKPFIDRVSPSVDSLLHVEKTVNLHSGEKNAHH
ncbi:MAG: NADH-quinone oxidoreductase subunit M [Nitrospinae bacterium]|nr:NADH-quinone oxidoreductase subunit M [Nitrospinota bacterium]MDA1110580.1 NADH-quinone oxidoreductase subunit M [Nitrospinota bacterium]